MLFIIEILAKSFVAMVVLLLLFGIYISKEQKWLLSSIFAPLPDSRKNQLMSYIKQEKKDFDDKFLSCFENMNDTQHWLAFRIDWCDVDEVEAQGNAIAQTYGIDGQFNPPEIDDDSSVWSLLVAYDIWLQQKGYQVVLWDQGSDEYCGFICKREDIRRFLRVGKLCTIKLMKLDHINEQ